jgi:hypothetical protein
MTPDSLSEGVYIALGCWFVIMVTLEVLFRRAVNRTIRQVDRWQHRNNLQRAANAGESAIEFHAMQCTYCGGFHSEDDWECPVREIHLAAVIYHRLQREFSLRKPRAE